VGHAGNGGPTLAEGIKYFADREVGGNMLTIHFAHSIEYIFYVLGEFTKNWNSVIANQRTTVDLTAKDGTIVEKNVKKTSPDQILVQGITSSGAVLSYHLREESAFPNTKNLDWRIYGDKGEIRVSSSSGFLHIGSPDDKIEISENGQEVKEVEARKDEWEELAPPGRNIARIYEAFQAGKRGVGGEAGYRDFEHAVARHKLIDTMLDRFDSQ